MGTFNAIVGALGVVSTILGVVLGAKLFGPDRRKTDADAMKVMSDVGVVWLEKYEGLTEYVDELESTQNALFDWIRAYQDAHAKWLQQAVAALEDRGVLLPPVPDTPPIPPRARRPPRRKGDT